MVSEGLMRRFTEFLVRFLPEVFEFLVVKEWCNHKPLKVESGLATISSATRLVLENQIDFFSTIQFITGEIRVIFFDIDVRDITVIEQIKRHPLFQDSLPFIVSTSRGFHIHYYVSPEQQKKINTQALVSLLTNLKGIDLVCTIDMSRKVRVPFTLTNKYGELQPIVPLHPNSLKPLTLSEALEWIAKAQNLTVELPSSVFSFSSSRTLSEKVKFPSYILSPEYREIMWRLIFKLVRDEDIEHFHRFAIATFLRCLGWSKEEIHRLFAFRSDYDWRMTEYQLSHIFGEVGSRKVYFPPSLSKLKEYGFPTLSDISEFVR